MRKLPVYILIDSSESMIGKAFDDAQKGIELIISTLRHDPYVLEVAAVSIISFNGKATVLTPLTEIYRFKKSDLPPIQLGTGSSLGAALNLLVARIRLEVVKTTETRRGDYLPIVFLLTDGVPTDDWRAAYDRFCAIKPRPASIYPLGCGDDVDAELLNEIPFNVVRFDADSTEELKAIIEPIIEALTLRLFYTSYDWDHNYYRGELNDDNDEGFDDLPPPPPGVTLLQPEPFQNSTSEDTSSRSDDVSSNVQDCECSHNKLAHSLFLHAMCATNEKNTLVRFTLDKETRLYTEAKLYPLPDDFDDSCVGSDVPRVSSHLLRASIPPCPYCGNDWLICGKCGSFYCDPMKPNSTSICPCCGSKGFVSYNGAAIDVVAKDSCGIAYGRTPYGGAIIDVRTSMG